LDNPAVTDTFDPRQRHADLLETMQTQQDGRQTQLHTAMPGVITKYDATKMTVEVQPSIQSMQTMPDGTYKPLTITVLKDVPVMNHGGGGHGISFPIAAGDGCLLVFAERSIDNWYQHGGTQKPFDWRMHDMADAIALVGLRSQPAVPGRAKNTTAVSAKTVQLRSDDGQMIIELDPAGPTINIAAAKDVNVSGVHWVVLSAKDTVFLQAPNAIDLTAPTTTIHGDLHVTGEVTGMFGGSSVTLTKHTHSALNQPPTVGTAAEPAVITGSTGGNEALKNLLQFLQSRGDIMDQST
jgi:phage baseplate assembly protein gpV